MNFYKTSFILQKIMENNMKVKFAIVTVILLLVFTSCIKLDEEISKETIFIPTTIVSKHYEEPKTELKYQFIMGKYQWLPSTEPAHYYVEYEYVLEDVLIKKKIDDSYIFNSVEVGDKVFTSFTKLTMKSDKTGELYNKYFFNKIELQ